MVERRDAVVAAAIEVLALGGPRRLTHRAVDAAADLPAGSTSNVFRTRAALVAGVLEALSARERAGLAALGGATEPVDADSLTTLAAGFVDDALGAGRTATLARRALFHDAASDDAVAAELLAATRFWWQVVADLLQRAGAPEPPRRARWLLAYIDGVISDQLARPEPGFDAVAALAPAVYGVLRYPSE